MIPVVRLEDVVAKQGMKTGYDLLGEEQGCVNGSRCGVSFYRFDEFGPAASHDDQEGFYVLEGRGRALIDGEELQLEPGMCFMVPANTPHVMCREKGEEYCKVFWFHAAVDNE